MSEELKPCPFCGNTNVYGYKEILPSDDNPQYQVICDWYYGGCGSSSGYWDSMEECVKAWNRRADEVTE